MSLMDLLEQAQGGGLDGLAVQLGIDPKTARALADQFAPAISGGVKRRAAQEGGLGTVLGALKGEDRVRYLEHPVAAAGPEAQAEGADFLAQIFGEREAVPALAQAAAERTGASVSEAQSLLPALAAMLQGGLQKQAPDAQVEAGLRGLQASGGDQAGTGLGDLLGMLQQGGGAGGGGLLGGLMGALSGGGQQGGSGGAGQLGGLLQMLDADGDGSPLDDVIGRFIR